MAGASSIMVIDGSLLVAVALAVGVLAAAFSIGAFCTRRRRGRTRAGSAARAPQVAAPYAALGEGR
jgi:hypothetical protein